MNILISNDDGVFAPGILAAKQAVEDLADVTVVAPDKNNSSVGRRLTLFKHLKIESCELEDKSRAYSVSGSPADSVVVGAKYVMDEKPDLVISGINQGVNISCDITSSGTVCANAFNTDFIRKETLYVAKNVRYWCYQCHCWRADRRDSYRSENLLLVQGQYKTCSYPCR